jgi:hypothetical protein
MLSPSSVFVEVRKPPQKLRPMDKVKAMELQKEHRITKLGQTLLSSQASSLFSNGFIFAGVLRKGQGMYTTPSREYVTLDIDNQWKDKALFLRKIDQQTKDNTKCNRSNKSTDESRAIRNDIKNSIYEWITEEEI